MSFAMSIGFKLITLRTVARAPPPRVAADALGPDWLDWHTASTWMAAQECPCEAGSHNPEFLARRLGFQNAHLV